MYIYCIFIATIINIHNVNQMILILVPLATYNLIVMYNFNNSTHKSKEGINIL